MHKEWGGWQKEPFFYPREWEGGIQSSGAGGCDMGDVVAADWSVIIPVRSYCLWNWEAQKGLHVPSRGLQVISQPCRRGELPRHCQSCSLQRTSARPSAFPCAPGESQADTPEPCMGLRCSAWAPGSPPDSSALGFAAAEWSQNGGRPSAIPVARRRHCAVDICPGGAEEMVTLFPSTWPRAD